MARAGRQAGRQAGCQAVTGAAEAVIVRQAMRPEALIAGQPEAVIGVAEEAVIVHQAITDANKIAKLLGLNSP